MIPERNPAFIKLTRRQRGVQQSGTAQGALKCPIHEWRRRAIRRRNAVEWCRRKGDAGDSLGEMDAPAITVVSLVDGRNLLMSRIVGGFLVLGLGLSVVAARGPGPGPGEPRRPSSTRRCSRSQEAASSPGRVLTDEERMEFIGQRVQAPERARAQVPGAGREIPERSDRGRRPDPGGLAGEQHPLAGRARGRGRRRGPGPSRSCSATTSGATSSARSASGSPTASARSTKRSCARSWRRTRTGRSRRRPAWRWPIS